MTAPFAPPVVRVIHARRVLPVALREWAMAGLVAVWIGIALVVGLLAEQVLP